MIELFVNSKMFLSEKVALSRVNNWNVVYFQSRGGFLIDYFSSKQFVESDRILYTPSGFAKNFLIYLQETGRLSAIAAHSSSRENLQSFLCFIVLDGEGKLYYDNHEYRINKGDCVFIDCRNTYTHMTGIDGEKLWSLQWCHFYGTNLPYIYNKYLERGGKPVFHPAKIKQIIGTMDSIYQIAESDDYIRDMRINDRLSYLLTLLMEESWHPDSVVKRQKKVEIVKIKEYLDANYNKKVSLDELCSTFYINKYYMMKLFSEAYGTTINNYVNSVRVTKAKQLLRFSDKRIDEIGSELGFDDANYFSRLFKKIEGMSPSEYRRKW